MGQFSGESPGPIGIAGVFAWKKSSADGKIVAESTKLGHDEAFLEIIIAHGSHSMAWSKIKVLQNCQMPGWKM